MPPSKYREHQANLHVTGEYWLRLDILASKRISRSAIVSTLSRESSVDQYSKEEAHDKSAPTGDQVHIRPQFTFGIRPREETNASRELEFVVAKPLAAPSPLPQRPDEEMIIRKLQNAFAETRNQMFASSRASRSAGPFRYPDRAISTLISRALDPRKSYRDADHEARGTSPRCNALLRLRPRPVRSDIFFSSSPRDGGFSSFRDPLASAEIFAKIAP
jgi:hypothetical protein